MIALARLKPSLIARLPVTATTCPARSRHQLHVLNLKLPAESHHGGAGVCLEKRKRLVANISTRGFCVPRMVLRQRPAHHHRQARLLKSAETSDTLRTVRRAGKTRAGWWRSVFWGSLWPAPRARATSCSPASRLVLSVSGMTDNAGDFQDGTGRVSYQGRG